MLVSGQDSSSQGHTEHQSYHIGFILYVSRNWRNIVGDRDMSGYTLTGLAGWSHGLGCFCTKGRKRCRIKCLNLYCTMWEAGQYWTLEKPYFPWSTKNYQEFSAKERAVSFSERWKVLSFLAGNLESSELLSSLASYVLNDKLRAKCVTEIALNLSRL